MDGNTLAVKADPPPADPDHDRLARLAAIGTARAASVLCLSLHEMTGDMLDHAMAADLVRRVLGAYFDSIQGMTR